MLVLPQHRGCYPFVQDSNYDYTGVFMLLAWYADRDPIDVIFLPYLGELMKYN